MLIWWNLKQNSLPDFAAIGFLWYGMYVHANAPARYSPNYAKIHLM